MTGPRPHRGSFGRLLSSAERGTRVGPGSVGARRVVRAPSTPEPIPAAVSCFTDDFNRADSSTLGDLSGGTGTWVNLTESGSGGWGIESNKARCVVGSNTDHFGWVETSATDGTLQMTCQGGSVFGGRPGPMFRFVDSTNFWVINQYPDWPGELWLRHFGTFSKKATWSNNSPAGHVWTVNLSGSSITVIRDGSTVASVTDSSLSHATKHGFYSYARGMTVDDWSFCPA